MNNKTKKLKGWCFKYRVVEVWGEKVDRSLNQIVVYTEDQGDEFTEPAYLNNDRPNWASGGYKMRRCG